MQCVEINKTLHWDAIIYLRNIYYDTKVNSFLNCIMYKTKWLYYLRSYPRTRKLKQDITRQVAGSNG